MESVSHLRPLQDFVLLDSADSSSKKTHQRWFKLTDDINQKLDASVAKSLRPYEKVNVMLICWEKADSNNLQDCTLFSKFLKDEFHYNTDILQLKGNNFSDNKRHLYLSLVPLVQNSSERTLTIVFYSGHGWSNATSPHPNTRKDCVLL